MMSDELQKYMASIGSRGGKASKGTTAAHERAKKANAARYMKPDDQDRIIEYLKQGGVGTVEAVINALEMPRSIVVLRFNELREKATIAPKLSNGELVKGSWVLNYK